MRERIVSEERKKEICLRRHRARLQTDLLLMLSMPATTVSHPPPLGKQATVRIFLLIQESTVVRCIPTT